MGGIMFNNSYDDCSKYLEHAEWLRLSDILNDWCKSDQSCKEIKKLAILGACEKEDIEYTRNDGKNFEDPVMDLYGRGLLLINKRSFNSWKLKFERKEQSFNNQTKVDTSLLDLIENIDAKYISVSDAIDAIHKHIGSNQNINKAVQILNHAIGQAFEPPNIYKRDDFKGWIPVVLKNQYNGGFIEAPNPSDQAKLEIIHYLINKEMQERLTKELDDDLPF